MGLDLIEYDTEPSVKKAGRKNSAELNRPKPLPAWSYLPMMLEG